MQTALAALPELPVVRLEPVAAPVWWPWRVQHEFGGVFGGVGHQLCAPGYHLALG